MIVPRFRIGEVVHHRRYDYRGVIVEQHASCQADEAWYTKNQTQPRRDQPWYHVLVDGGPTTYVAEENLEPDRSGRPIRHPMIRQFFASFDDGRYFAESSN
jgi:heat shock protein HspQ